MGQLKGRGFSLLCTSAAERRPILPEVSLEYFTPCTLGARERLHAENSPATTACLLLSPLLHQRVSPNCRFMADRGFVPW